MKKINGSTCVNHVQTLNQITSITTALTFKWATYSLNTDECGYSVNSKKNCRVYGAATSVCVETSSS